MHKYAFYSLFFHLSNWLSKSSFCLLLDTLEYPITVIFLLTRESAKTSSSPLLIVNHQGLYLVYHTILKPLKSVLL